MEQRKDFPYVSYSEIGRKIEHIALGNQLFDYVGEVEPIEGLVPSHLHILSAIKLGRNKTTVAPFPNMLGRNEELLMEELGKNIPELGEIEGDGTREEGGREMDDRVVIFGRFSFALPSGRRQGILFLPTVEYGRTILKALDAIDRGIKAGHRVPAFEEGGIAVMEGTTGELITSSKSTLREISRRDYNRLFGAVK